jgi:hypothetical protein
MDADEQFAISRSCLWLRGTIVTRNTMSVMQESLHFGNGHWQNKGTRGEREGGK